MADMDFKLSTQHALPPHHLQWDKLARSSSQADPFCCAPTWQTAFHDAFAPARRLLIRSSSDAVIAFAEHVASDKEAFLTPIEVNWRFGCPLLGKDAVGLFEDTLPEIERLHSPKPVHLLVSGIRPGGVLSRRLLRSFAPSFDIYLHSSSVQGAASLKDGVDGFLSRRSGNHRKKLKKQARRAAEAGVGFERISPTTSEQAETVFARMIEVELTSWKGIQQCGMAEPGSREFYDVLLKRLSASGSGRVVFARHDGADIGYIFGGMAGNVYRGQQFSYADTWKRHSIGNLLQLEKVTWLCEEGAKRYDMGPVTGPKMGYKSHWTERRAHIQTWLLVKRGR